jgi:hypothetical protein
MWRFNEHTGKTWEVFMAIPKVGGGTAPPVHFVGDIPLYG